MLAVCTLWPYFVITKPPALGGGHQILGLVLGWDLLDMGQVWVSLV